jgi:ubiquinone/menaquinone biosynthesis C-methylase UbiE
VACGTGRTLKLIRSTLPQASLFGTDLSPAYLRKANQTLSQIPGELPQLLQANAEELPYLDNYFHAVTCVFLFHELPAAARQQIIEQCFRVTQPGGEFIICDSIQVSDSPEMLPVMESFQEHSMNLTTSITSLMIGGAFRKSRRSKYYNRDSFHE